MPEQLAALLRRLLHAQFGGKKGAMAKAIGMTASPFGKVIEGKSVYFGFERCLRVALATGEPASNVLRAAGKAEAARLIEALYGEAKSNRLSEQDLQHLATWRALSADARSGLDILLRDALEGQQERKKGRRSA